MSDRIRIMNFGISWPPFTHGRVVCACGAVVAACACSQACHTVGTVATCPVCTPQRATVEAPPTPATKYHDTMDRYRNDARFHRAVNAVVGMALSEQFTPGELHDIAITAAIVHEMKFARPFIAVPKPTCDSLLPDAIDRRRD
jgi:hypothetical protein